MENVVFFPHPASRIIHFLNIVSVILTISLLLLTLQYSRDDANRPTERGIDELIFPTEE